jgi:hypothetical protein
MCVCAWRPTYVKYLQRTVGHIFIDKKRKEEICHWRENLRKTMNYTYMEMEFQHFYWIGLKTRKRSNKIQPSNTKTKSSTPIKINVGPLGKLRPERTTLSGLDLWIIIIIVACYATEDTLFAVISSFIYTLTLTSQYSFLSQSSQHSSIRTFTLQNYRRELTA